MKGKVVTEEEARNRTGWAWLEVRLFIFNLAPPEFLSFKRIYLTNRFKL